MKKLLIVIGAGASLEFGMLSVNSIDTLFEDWSKEILLLKNESDKSLYSWVKEKIRYYVSQNPKNRVEYIINFESLLYTIQNLASLSNDKNRKHFNNRLMPFIEVNEFPEVIRFGKLKAADGGDFRFLQSYLTDKLLEHFREKCKTLRKEKATELESLSGLFDKLKTEFEIGFVNLNYDNVILTSLPDLETGFDKKTGLFDRARLHGSKWNFCYHMHGSVHLDMKGGDGVEMHKILWNHDLNSKFAQNSSGRNGNFTGEGLSHLNSNIIAGLDKANQLLREPFGPYFMKLDQLVYESDAVLFMGYGFNDMHLNRVFPFVRYDENKTRKVVVIDWAADDEDGLNFRHDGWSFGVSSTLPFNAFEMGDGKSSLPYPAIHYKNKRIFEKSSNPKYPISVWYNGVLAACDDSNKILND